MKWRIAVCFTISRFRRRNPFQSLHSSVAINGSSRHIPNGERFFACDRTLLGFAFCRAESNSSARAQAGTNRWGAEAHPRISRGSKGAAAVGQLPRSFEELEKTRGSATVISISRNAANRPLSCRKHALRCARLTTPFVNGFGGFAFRGNVAGLSTDARLVPVTFPSADSKETVDLSFSRSAF